MKKINGSEVGGGFRIGRGCALNGGALWDPRGMEADIHTYYMVLISVTVCVRAGSSHLPARLHGGCHYSL